MFVNNSTQSNEYYNGSGGSVLSGFATSFRPLYFELKQVKEVMSTGQPCDLAYDFGDGLLDLQDYPQGFPKPGEIILLLSNTMNSFVF
jgi:hypothetical protein